ncbi:hypothetical protein SAMN05444004_105205 [Jannaschia faecimaris]|uniref:Uncharacterized protein n=1 Tax=Jannaschia faecimaris TaxID=1244108 RepID=A0A1H3PX75_9RHOB|nr:hypothetical protein SAMN05444004_105205 [Jannaschia faecimaris]
MPTAYQTDLFIEGMFVALLREGENINNAFRIAMENPAAPDLSEAIRQARLQRHLH